jgi:hypothetical protein
MRYLERTIVALAVLLLAALATVTLSHRNREIATSLRIDRPPADVWCVLVDTAAYPTWNPMISRIRGELRTGSAIEIDLGSQDSDIAAFHPTVLAVQLNRELRWPGQAGMAAINSCWRSDSGGCPSLSGQ